MNDDLTLALAPMEGVTDDLVRAMFGALGGLDYAVSEFVRVTDHPLSAKNLLRDVPELRNGSCAEGGLPVHVQLLGGNPERVGASAAVAVSLGARVIDLNFGCPAPTVNRHDGGATLLKDPARVTAVTRAVRESVPADVPVSAKVRLGWDDPDAIESIAVAAERGGAAWLTVHGRTRAQGYAPPADWVRIGRARRAVGIPVVANGDIRSIDDLSRCREVTGCARFMIGRGAMERPEIFRLARGTDATWWRSDVRLGLIREYARRSLAQGPGREGVTLSRVKQWGRAMAGGEPALGPFFDVLKRCSTLDAALACVDAHTVRREESEHDDPLRSHVEDHHRRVEIAG